MILLRRFRGRTVGWWIRLGLHLSAMGSSLLMLAILCVPGLVLVLPRGLVLFATTVFGITAVVYLAPAYAALLCTDFGDPKT